MIVIASDDAPNIGVDTYTDTAKMSERKFTVRVTHVSESRKYHGKPERFPKWALR